MKKFILALVLMPNAVLFSQEKQIVDLNLVDSGYVEVLNVLPDSFPSVELIIRVSDSENNPVWDLDLNGFELSEDGVLMPIKSVQQISQDKPINISMILDESGSMSIDEDQLFDRQGNALYRFNIFGDVVYPKGYLAPITSLKKAAKNFVTGFDFDKDSISLITFSSQVNKVIPPGASQKELKRGIKLLEADGATAFYDALNEGLDQLKNSSGFKVIVAITDGKDNQSSHDFEEVLLKAQLQEIPLHIIGVGNVNQDSLSALAIGTEGTYYYSKNAQGLEEVYDRVKSNIQSIYGLVYTSENFNPTDTSRSLLVQYSTDSSFATVNTDLELPEEVVEYLENRRNRRMIYTSVGAGVAIGIAGFLILYRRRDKKNIA